MQQVMQLLLRNGKAGHALVLNAICTSFAIRKLRVVKLRAFRFHTQESTSLKVQNAQQQRPVTELVKTTGYMPRF